MMSEGEEDVRRDPVVDALGVRMIPPVVEVVSETPLRTDVLIEASSPASSGISSISCTGEAIDRLCSPTMTPDDSESDTEVESDLDEDARLRPERLALIVFPGLEI